MCLLIVPVIVFVIPDMVTATSKTRKIVKFKDKDQLNNKIRNFEKHRGLVKPLDKSDDTNTSTAISTDIFDGMFKILSYYSLAMKSKCFLQCTYYSGFYLF